MNMSACVVRPPAHVATCGAGGPPVAVPGDVLTLTFDTKIFHFVCRLSSLYIRTVPRGVRRGVRGVRGVPSVEPALEPPPDMKSLLSGDASHLAAALRVANRFL